MAMLIGGRPRLTPAAAQIVSCETGGGSSACGMRRRASLRLADEQREDSPAECSGGSQARTAVTVAAVVRRSVVVRATLGKPPGRTSRG